VAMYAVITWSGAMMVSSYTHSGLNYDWQIVVIFVS
jgi:hypothetical protein